MNLRKKLRSVVASNSEFIKYYKETTNKNYLDAYQFDHCLTTYINKLSELDLLILEQMNEKNRAENNTDKSKFPLQ